MPDSAGERETLRAAERRQLTVMFCDLVDSTPMASRLDPEDTGDVYRAFRDLCATSIAAAGGHVAKHMGDGLMAYFGYPAAHEDDAERAVHAALAVSSGTPGLAPALEPTLAARVGIATGFAMVGDLVGETASEAGDVVGETPNFAARLQSAAVPGEILVSDTTRQLAAGLFEFESAGKPVLKGLTLRAPVWRAKGLLAAPDRFRARRTAGAVPMMGRDAELESLMARWERAKDGERQVVGLIGEAGIGKSRLVDEFHRRLRGPHIWLEGGGAQLFQNSPMSTIAQTITRRLSGGRRLAPEALGARLDASLRSVGIDDSAVIALVADAIDARLPDAAAPLDLASDARRRTLFDTLTDWVLMSADRWPTLLIMEDLQWVDPSTREFLAHLRSRADGRKLMVLYTARPGALPPWPSESDEQIALARLDRESARNLVTAAASRPLAREMVDKLVARAGGVPLFAEELARLAGEGTTLDDAAIPSALSDLLMARLDQLGPSKTLAQTAAVIGGEISRPLLAAVTGQDEAALDLALAPLIEAGVIAPGGAGDQATVAFRHALFESAAYETLLKRVRRSLHGRVARTLIERFPDVAERRPELLAEHWLKAGEHAEAIQALRRAASLAYHRHAFREAQAACASGIAVIAGLPATDEARRAELSLQNLLADASRAVDGYASDQAVAAVARARELAGADGSLADLLRGAFGEWAAASSLGDYAAAAGPADRYIALARAEGEGRPSVLGSAQMILMTRFRQGDLAAAEAAYRAGEPYFADPAYCRRAGVAAQTFGNAAVIAWLLGRYDQAAERNARSLEVSRSTGNPYDVAFALYMAAHQALLEADPVEAERLSLDAIRLCDENGYHAVRASMHIMLGRAKAGLGRAQEGMAMIDDALHGEQNRMRRSSVTLYLTWLAEARVLAGETARAEAAIEEALTINPMERFFRPEALRLRGDIARGRGRSGEARADYEAALVLARSMGARVLAERAGASLAALGGAVATPSA